MLGLSPLQEIAVDTDGIYCDMAWWGGDGNPVERKEPQYCERCGHRLAECNETGRCFHECKERKR